MLPPEPAGRGSLEIPRTTDHGLRAALARFSWDRLVVIQMTTKYSPRALRKAWWGVVVLFLVHGLVVSSWISRIPAVQTELQLSNGVLGLTLLSSAIGAVLTIPAVGYLISRFGSRRMSILSSFAFCWSIVLMSLATGAVSLGAALFVFG